MKKAITLLELNQQIKHHISATFPDTFHVIADLLEIEPKELIRLWSADKVYDIIVEEEEATQILNVVAESIEKYKRKSVKV